MEEKETFIDQEKKFLKGLLEKYRSENPKEEINLEEEIKRIDEEIRRMEEEDPSIIEKAEEFWDNLLFEEEDDENDLENEEFNIEKKERVYTLKNKTKIKKEFIEAELNKKYQNQLDNLDKEINQILENLHFKDLK